MELQKNQGDKRKTLVLYIQEWFSMQLLKSPVATV